MSINNNGYMGMTIIQTYFSILEKISSVTGLEEHKPTRVDCKPQDVSIDIKNATFAWDCKN